MYKNRLTSVYYEILKAKGYKWIATSSCKCGCTYAYKEEPVKHIDIDYFNDSIVGYFKPQRGDKPLLVASFPLEGSWEDSLKEIV